MLVPEHWCCIFCYSVFRIGKFRTSTSSGSIIILYMHKINFHFSCTQIPQHFAEDSDKRQVVVVGWRRCRRWRTERRRDNCAHSWCECHTNSECHFPVFSTIAISIVSHLLCALQMSTDWWVCERKCQQHSIYEYIEFELQVYRLVWQDSHFCGIFPFISSTCWNVRTTPTDWTSTIRCHKSSTICPHRWIRRRIVLHR